MDKLICVRCGKVIDDELYFTDVEDGVVVHHCKDCEGIALDIRCSACENYIPGSRCARSEEGKKSFCTYRNGSIDRRKRKYCDGFVRKPCKSYNARW